MRAIVIRRHGGPDLFEATEMPEPVLKPGHMILEVRATSVNPVDMKLRAAPASFANPFPAILHGDVAGVVLDAADDVAAFSPGDRVYGCAGGMAGVDGALAERMLVDAALMAKMPASADFREAAALPLVAITAWEALVEKVRLGAGDHLLVFGATGGVGHIAIQLARHLQAEVTATASYSKKDAAGLLKPDHLAFHDRETIVQMVEKHSGGVGFDCVLDTVGGENLAKAMEVARIHGQVVSLTRVTIDTSPVVYKSLSHHGVFIPLPLITGTGRAAHGEILRRVAELVDAGAIAPMLDEMRFGISQASPAHERLASGRAIGKVVLEADL